MHVTRDDIRDLFRDGLGAADRRRVVRHLLSGCRRCRAIAHELSRVERNAAHDYDAVFDSLDTATRLLPAILAEERSRAREQWTYLLRLSPAQRRLRVENDPRFLTFGLQERLRDGAATILRTDPLLAIEQAELSIAIGARLSPKTYGRGVGASSWAGTYATLGNAQRLACHFSRSAASLARAERCLGEEGDVDLAELAQVRSLMASLETDMGNFYRALDLLGEVRSLYEKLGDRHLVGRADVKRGLVVGYLDPEKGIQLLARSRMLIDVRREPRLLLALRHSTATFLCDLGREREARELFERSRPIYRRFDDRSTLIHAKWLEARIDASLGWPVRSAERFRQSAQEALDHGFLLENELILSDLAELQARSLPGR